MGLLLFNRKLSQFTKLVSKAFELTQILYLSLILLVLELKFTKS